ncbi:TKL protein kinase [Phytophthora cinnamomi]|uniref:TKL protein kinase n=1 Tax=Phytophthora cinnamomi TaxID=4785 RepID=UPI003559D98B|nr:TKL protein kinase [Phytophthora cinnamomi]
MSAAAESELSDEDVESAQSWLVENFLDGETQLFGGSNRALNAVNSSLQVCGGLPSLVTRSSSVKPNGACPTIFTDVNASCTCLSGFDDGDDAWEFRIRSKRDGANTISFPTTQTAADTLEVDAIQTLYVPDTLQKLSIIGIGESPLSITFVPEYRNQAGHEFPIARTLDSTSNLSAITLVNIDMFETVTIVSSFMPSSTTSVSMRNCNISSFGFEFTMGLNNLTHFDLSSNNMDAAYAGTGNQLLANRCFLTLCDLEEYNLSYNKFTILPTTPLNVKTLRKFYIQGNNISSFDVNATTFGQIENLEDFKADLPGDSAICNAGQWKTTHGAIFCVADSSSTGNSSSGTNPLTFVLFAGVVVVVLLLCVLILQWITYRKNRSSEIRSHASSEDHLYSIFNPDFEAHETMRVIHRDLKSKNVLLNEEMEAKLSDFGISRERHDLDTHMTAGMGTSFWIAPEVLSGQDYDERADVFSFGVVLSELDTDDYPYWNASNLPRNKLQEGEILQLVAAGQMRPSFSRSCPGAILEVANRCLQVRPEHRPSAAELVQVFQGLLLLELSSSLMDLRVSSSPSLSTDSVA